MTEKFKADRDEARRRILVSHHSEDEAYGFDRGADWGYEYAKKELAKKEVGPAAVQQIISMKQQLTERDEVIDFLDETINAALDDSGLTAEQAIIGNNAILQRAITKLKLWRDGELNEK